MKIKLITSTIFILLLTNVLTISFNAVPTVLAQGDVPYEALDDVGTHFELQYFNVFITTNTTVHILLRASSEMIDYFIENGSKATSTQLTLGNLQPSTTYYMYEDSYMNEEVFTTDDVGSHTYTQDLSQPHHVFIQPKSSTIFISKSTTLTSNINESVEIIANNIVLDLNGYNITARPKRIGIGVTMYGRNNVTVKNGGIYNFFAGIDLYWCTDIVIRNNTIASNLVGLELARSNFNMITDNNFTLTGTGIVAYGGASGNIIYHNNFIRSGAYIVGVSNNIWDNGYPSGGNYWSYYTGVDLYSGPYQNEPYSDGIGDTPYGIGVDNEDRYPFMDESGWLTPKLPPKQIMREEILVIESWDLDGGVEESLTTKLEEAMNLLDKGNTNGAIHKLQDLIKKVTNDAYHLTQEQRDYLIQTTQEIINRIG